MTEWYRYLHRETSCTFLIFSLVHYIYWSILPCFVLFWSSSSLIRVGFLGSDACNSPLVPVSLAMTVQNFNLSVKLHFIFIEFGYFYKIIVCLIATFINDRNAWQLVKQTLTTSRRCTANTRKNHTEMYVRAFDINNYVCCEVTPFPGINKKWKRFTTEFYLFINLVLKHSCWIYTGELTSGTL